MSYTNLVDTVTTLKTQTNSTNYENNKASGNDELDQNAFLQLMITQLQNQDPLDPMDNSEFLSQQAMFSQVNSLQEMNDNLATYGDALVNGINSMQNTNTLTQATNLIGKEITAPDPDNTSETITGTVDSVTVTDGEVTLSVNGKNINYNSVTSVQNAQTDGTSSTSETTSDSSSEIKESAMDFLSEILKNPKLNTAASNLIEKLAGDLI